MCILFLAPQPQEVLVLHYLEGKLSYPYIPFIVPLTMNYAFNVSAVPGKESHAYHLPLTMKCA